MALVQHWASSCTKERNEQCEISDHQENCSKGIDPLNNSYMTDVMIIAELLLLKGRKRDIERERDQPGVKFKRDG